MDNIVSLEKAKEIVRSFPNHEKLCEAGLDNASWMAWIATIESQRDYLKTIADWLEYYLEVKQTAPETTHIECLIQYFFTLHSEGKYSAQTLNGFLTSISRSKRGVIFPRGSKPIL